MEESSNGNIIKDRNALKAYINNLKSKIEQLEEIGHFNDAHKYTENVSYLSSKLASWDGILCDPLTEQKYFLSTVKLKGGISSYAHECSNFKKEDLYQQTNNEEIVIDALRFMCDQRRFFNYFCNPTAGIFIQNSSKYELEYCSSGNAIGYFFTSNFQETSFQGPCQTIQPDYSAGFIHTIETSSFGGPSG
jgi:hypothetical protein